MRTPSGSGAQLSKSGYAAALQCPKRLWLAANAPDRAGPRSASQRASAEEGVAVGRHALQLFPGGVLVDPADSGRVALIARTRQLLSDPEVPAIFEAAFEHAGVSVRVDILERLGENSWGLREVKSSLSVRDEHLDDVALQLFVLRGAGLQIASIEVIHLEPDYRREGAETAPDWERVFRRSDVAREAEFLLSDIPKQVTEMTSCVSRGAPPELEPSPHCRRPRPCEFWAHCTAGKPDDWIMRLPGLRAAEFHQLCELGVERISEIPATFRLPQAQARARAAHLQGAAAVSEGLDRALRSSGPPCFYLDFEAMAPAIPLYSGMSPYSRVPFQWSLHRCDEQAVLSHDEFLADGIGDPRRKFAETLLSAVGDSGLPALVYSSYESGVLAELADCFPDLAPDLERLCGQLFDLLPVVRKSIYQVDFMGSFSIKRVVPALVAGFGYGDLDEIAEGAEAARAIARLASGDLDDQESSRLRAALLAYCKRDTQALIELHAALRAAGRAAGKG